MVARTYQFVNAICKTFFIYQTKVLTIILKEKGMMLIKLASDFTRFESIGNIEQDHCDYGTPVLLEEDP